MSWDSPRTCNSNNFERRLKLCKAPVPSAAAVMYVGQHEVSGLHGILKGSPAETLEAVIFGFAAISLATLIPTLVDIPQ